MEEWLIAATEQAVMLIDFLALIIIVYGTLEAFLSVLRGLPYADAYRRREVWLRYARWLVAGLTFQLAADIIETSIASSWDALGRTAAIALIRTFLNYFLERDLDEVRELQHQPPQAPAAMREEAPHDRD